MIFLKSPGVERPAAEEPTSSQRHEPISERPGAGPETDYGFLPTYSSLSLLRQAKKDLKHPSPRIRIFAIQYLEKCDPSVAIPLLQESLSDRDPEIRAQALSSLVQFHDAHMSPMIKKYLKDSDPGVRVAAVRGLFEHGEKVDMNLLLQLMDDESARVRRKVATLLGWTQGEGVFPILAQMSKDQDPQVRKAALLSMVSLYPQEGENRLLEALSDPAPEVRKWVQGTLEKLMDRPPKRAVSSKKRYRGSDI